MMEVKLGQLITEAGAQRDAVHIAVFPAVASGILTPGVPVRLINGNRAVECRSTDRRAVGIVDPFLKERVIRGGQQLWICLFPNTVNGMRHHWSHPMFDAQIDNQHEKWIRDFARRWCLDFDELIEQASSDSDNRYVVAYGVDLQGPNDLGEDHDLFWEHLEGYLGMTFGIESRAGMVWSCTC